MATETITENYVVVDGDITALMQEHFLVEFDSEQDPIDFEHKYYLEEFIYTPKKRKYKITIEVKTFKKSDNSQFNGNKYFSFTMTNVNGYDTVDYVDGVADESTRVTTQPILSFTNVKNAVLQSLPLIIQDLNDLNAQGRLYRP